MICYRDMTFCKRTDCEKFKECPRALTEEVFEKAEKWWGSKDVPISVGFFKKCYETKCICGTSHKDEFDIYGCAECGELYCEKCSEFYETCQKCGGKNVR